MNEELNTYQAGAFLPGIQAVFSGVFFTGVLGGVLWWIHAARPGELLLLGFFCSGACVWFLLLRHWLRLVDFHAGFYNHQPRVQVIDAPTYQPTVKVELLEQEGTSWRGQYIDVPATQEQLRLLASGVVSGGTLSESGWCGSGRPFTKAQFHALRQALIERGWLQWRNVAAPAQGVQVSPVGKRVFQHLVEGTYLPTETREDW